MCKKKLGHKKLEKTTLGIMEGTGNILAEFVTLHYFWSGQTNLVAKIGPPGPIFHPILVQPVRFYPDHFSVTVHHKEVEILISKNQVLQI